MALSVVAQVSPPSFALCNNNNFKLSPGKSSKERTYEIEHIKLPKGVMGKFSRIVYGSARVASKFTKGKFVPGATSEDQLVYEDLTSNDLEAENLKLAVEETILKGISSISVERTDGKPGFISFRGLPYQRRDENIESIPLKETPKIYWYAGPTALVTFLVVPSLFLRWIFSVVLEDSLLTDFLILFFTEALFYGGVAIFVLLVDRIWRPLQERSPKSYDWSKFQSGPRVLSVATLVISLVVPLVTMGLVWPWTGPAASATLAPYLVGLVVQFAFEQFVRRKKSPAWPVIPIIFQIYRLHQLNRAAQLVTALSFSVRGAEMTSQTMAINTSLAALLTVLQILGVISFWLLASYVMRFLPTSQAIPDS